MPITHHMALLQSALPCAKLVLFLCFILQQSSDPTRTETLFVLKVTNSLNCSTINNYDF